MRLVFFLFTAFLYAARFALADTIVLAADPWCPYNCVSNSEHPGFMVEVAREALEPYGYTVVYRELAWARALAQAEAGQVNGVIGAIPEEAPGFIFGPPIGTFVDAVVFRRGEARAIESHQNLSGLRVGAINGYEYFGAIGDYIERNKNDRTLVQFASGDDALTINLGKLRAGRLDLVAEVRAVLDYRIATMGHGDDFDVVDLEPPSDLFIALSPKLVSSDLIAKRLADGIERLRASGRFQEILGKYGLAK